MSVATSAASRCCVVVAGQYGRCNSADSILSTAEPTGKVVLRKEKRSTSAGKLRLRYLPLVVVKQTLPAALRVYCTPLCLAIAKALSRRSVVNKTDRSADVLRPSHAYNRVAEPSSLIGFLDRYRCIEMCLGRAGPPLLLFYSGPRPSTQCPYQLQYVCVLRLCRAANVRCPRLVSLG